MGIRFASARLRALFAGLLLCAVLPAHADLTSIRAAGSLKVAVYNDFAPYSDQGQGIDVDLARALADRLKLKLNLMPFPAGDEMADDLRNMVWKGHYMGYGPADVMLHVPVDNHLMSENPQVKIFAPYHVETVRLVRSAQRIPVFEGIDSLEGKTIGVQQVSISGLVMLGEGNGRFRDKVRIYPTAIDALVDLKQGKLDAVLATRSEIESVLRGDAAFPVEQVAFDRLPRSGWAVGMAVRKDDVELARALQGAINDMAADGELKAIFAKHGVQVAKP